MTRHGALSAALALAVALVAAQADDGCKAQCTLGNVTATCDEQISKVMQQTGMEACTAAYGHVLTSCSRCQDCSLAQASCHKEGSSTTPAEKATTSEAPKTSGDSADAVRARIAELSDKLKDLDKMQTEADKKIDSDSKKAAATFANHFEDDKEGEGKEEQDSKPEVRHVDLDFHLTPKVAPAAPKPKPKPVPHPAPVPAAGPDSAASGCDKVCEAQGYAATCKEHVLWLSKHKFQTNQRGCIDAYQMLLENCNHACGQCSLHDTTCLDGLSVKALEPDRHHGSTTAGPRAAAAAAPAPPEPTKAPENGGKPAFDCSGGFDDTEQARKAWCCENEGRGCPENAYDCQDASEADHLWTKGKKIWCCKHTKVCTGNVTMAQPQKLWSEGPAEAPAQVHLKPGALPASGVAVAAVAALAVLAVVRVRSTSARGACKLFTRGSYEALAEPQLLPAADDSTGVVV